MIDNNSYTILLTLDAKDIGNPNTNNNFTCKIKPIVVKKNSYLRVNQVRYVRQLGRTYEGLSVYIREFNNINSYVVNNSDKNTRSGLICSVGNIPSSVANAKEINNNLGSNPTLPLNNAGDISLNELTIELRDYNGDAVGKLDVAQFYMVITITDNKKLTSFSN